MKEQKSTSGKHFIERFNNSLREHVSRLVREALSCSKKVANPLGVITLCIYHDNLTRAAASNEHDMDIMTGGTRPGRRRRGSRGPFATVLTRSGLDADNRVPVGRVLVGGDPGEERVVEETPDELHADWETGRRLPHGKGERRVARVVEGQGAWDPILFIAERLSSTAS